MDVPFAALPAAIFLTFRHLGQIYAKYPDAIVGVFLP